MVETRNVCDGGDHLSSLGYLSCDGGLLNLSPISFVPTWMQRLILSSNWTTRIGHHIINPWRGSVYQNTGTKQRGNMVSRMMRSIGKCKLINCDNASIVRKIHHTKERRHDNIHSIYIIIISL